MTNDTLAKLAACPFCGDEPRMSEDDRGFDHVYCYGCGAGGPSHDTKDEAAEAWNRRALTAQALPAAEPVKLDVMPIFWKCFRNFPSTAGALTHTVWKDGIDIDKLSAPMQSFCDALIQAAQQAAQAAAGWREQHDRDSAELRSLCHARDEARRERDLCRVEIAGLNSSVGHLSALVDHQTDLLAQAMQIMKTLHASATPDDSNEAMDAIIPGADFAKFVDDHARLMYLTSNSPVAALPQPQPQSAQSKGDA